MAVSGRTGIFPHKIDSSTDANTTIEYEHKEVHAGKAFYITVVDTVNESDQKSIRFQTPSTTTWMHMLWVIEAQSNILIELREGITNALEGTGAFNRNRNFADSPTMVVESILDVATGGTVIYSWSSGGAAANPSVAKSPTTVRSSGEIVLKQNEKYELRITSSVDANTISAYVTWYEHANVE